MSEVGPAELKSNESQSSIRGLALDVFAFAVNLATMSGAANLFRSIVSRASQDDPSAMRWLFAIAVAMFVLAPVGAVLGRWHYHQRLGPGKDRDGYEHLGGCLFNPIFYFCLTAVIFASVNAFVLQEVYGKQEPDEGIFVGSIFGGLVLMIVHVVLVYRYFSSPKAPPKSSFLRGRASKYAADACFFLNMAIFQQIWGLIGEVKAPPPAGAFDLVARIVLILFLSLMLYFPPRMFYLAEDIKKRWTWAMILVANVPILARFVFGFGS